MRHVWPRDRCVCNSLGVGRAYTHVCIYIYIYICVCTYCTPFVRGGKKFKTKNETKWVKKEKNKHTHTRRATYSYGLECTEGIIFQTTVLARDPLCSIYHGSSGYNASAHEIRRQTYNPLPRSRVRTLLHAVSDRQRQFSGWLRLSPTHAPQQ